MAAGANLATTLATSVGFWYLYIYYKTIKKEIAKELILSLIHILYKGVPVFIDSRADLYAQDFNGKRA